ncbi:L,D-transpeptidase family protein [Phototrophicus methaneseepsis]|uniref:L,D-transpeptidase family protein n=1 Tax=Phototrophicus methaneseepsis TaxID=2710758 RepID=A0A7S8E9R1_9CHLR|nr:L,D-transpeptidase family protein [Phototrophicus methaneseepsis]QPC82849.1 L,D-transpeptidase family protein [Phototrophicus methaneseepsis]
MKVQKYQTMPNSATPPRQQSSSLFPTKRPKRSQQQAMPPRAGVPARPMAPAPQPRPLPPRESAPVYRKRTRNRAVWIIGAVSVGVVFTAVALVMLIVGLSFMRGILPGVQVGDVSLAGLTVNEAAARLQNEYNTLTLRDGIRTWEVNAQTIGVALDAQQTAELAYAQGRRDGNAGQALFGKIKIDPVITVDATTADAELTRIAQQVNIAPQNAGVTLQNGKAVATPPELGRQLDVAAMLQQLQSDTAFVDGDLVLVMRDVAPAVTDSSALVASANALLNNPLDIRIYDAVTGDSIYWSLMPDTWGTWLSAEPDESSDIGLALTLQDAPLRDYLQAQANNTFDTSRTVNIDEGVLAVQSALKQGRPDAAVLTVEHLARTHTVQAGESIISIAWDYGIPYLFIQQANNNIQGVSVGQEITIPPADAFLELPVVPDKRIVVSISQQRTWIYENGQLKWEWPVSTGIADSPTWPGVYQILSHEPNAYAGNWDLYMPNFMGVYQPIPGSDFTNGFHGFPTRGGGQLLWENSLGTRVTYGCILLSNQNIRLLYDWAEEGVVVEIKA